MVIFWKKTFGLEIIKILFFRNEDWPELIIGMSEVSNRQPFFTEGSFGHYSFNLSTKQ